MATHLGPMARVMYFGSAAVTYCSTMRTKLARSYNARKDTTQVELIVRARIPPLSPRLSAPLGH